MIFKKIFFFSKKFKSSLNNRYFTKNQNLIKVYEANEKEL